MKSARTLSLSLMAMSLLLIACGDQEARRPVRSSQGTFYRISAERARTLLAEERAAMDQLISRDSTRSYLQSPYGMQYAYTSGPDSTALSPSTGDMATIRYQLRRLDGQILYSYAEIDTLVYRVDQDERIFKGLRDAVKVLREGESARFLIPSSLAYGFAGDGDKIDMAVPILADLELIDVIEREDNPK